MSFCKRAIAYIKEFIPETTEQETIMLSENESPVTKDLENGFLVTYLVDDGDHYTYVQYKHLKEEGITESELHAIGLDNLKDKAFGTIKIQEYGNLYAMFFDGNFEASLILLDELWDELLKQYVINGFIVAIPARDIIAFCDTQSVEGVSELYQLNERVYDNADHQLTNCLYKRNKKQWERALNT